MLDTFEIVETNDREVWLKISEMACKHEGWIVGKQDYECYIQGFGMENYWFVVAFKKDNNKLVGGVCGAHYPSKDGSPAMSSVGDFFLLPEYRGLGLGLFLFDRLLKNGKFVGQNHHLSSAPAMCHKYSQKFGFSKIMDWLLETYKIPTKDLDLDKIKPERLLENCRFICPQVEKDELGIPWSKVFEYDQQIYGGIRRDGYIRSVLCLQNSVSQIVLDAFTNKIIGFGCVREAIEGSLIVSPWYADSNEIARKMLYRMLWSYTCQQQRQKMRLAKSLNDYGQIVFLIPSTNTESKQVLKELNRDQEPIRDSFGYVNFNKYVVEVPVDKVFAITDLVMHIA